MGSKKSLIDPHFEITDFFPCYDQDIIGFYIQGNRKTPVEIGSHFNQVIKIDDNGSIDSVKFIGIQ